MIKVLSILALLTFTQFSFSGEITAEKKRVIDEMLEITGALEVGEMMGTAVANQMITAMLQQQKDLDPKIIAIVKDEVGRIMHDEFIANGFVNEMSYTIYHNSSFGVQNGEKQHRPGHYSYSNRIVKTSS